MVYVCYVCLERGHATKHTRKHHACMLVGVLSGETVLPSAARFLILEHGRGHHPDYEPLAPGEYWLHGNLHTRTGTQPPQNAKTSIGNQQGRRACLYSLIYVQKADLYSHPSLSSVGGDWCLSVCVQGSGCDSGPACGTYLSAGKRISARCPFRPSVYG